MTSAQTNKEIKKILDKHIPSVEVQKQLFTDLAQVAGNKSFKDSIYNLLLIITHDH